jgi:hypothetical protein
MKSPEQRFNPEAEISVEALQTRLDSLYTKFGIAPDEEVNFGDINFMFKATRPGSTEWIQTKFDVLKNMVKEASLGDESYQQADEALRSWEEHEPTK